MLFKLHYLLSDHGTRFSNNKFLNTQKAHRRGIIRRGERERLKLKFVCEQESEVDVVENRAVRSFEHEVDGSRREALVGACN